MWMVAMNVKGFELKGYEGGGEGRKSILKILKNQHCLVGVNVWHECEDYLLGRGSGEDILNYKKAHKARQCNPNQGDISF